MLLNYILGALIWSVLFFLVKRINSKYLVTTSQCKSVLGVIHAVSSSVFVVIYFLFFQPLSDYITAINTPVIVFLTMAGSYYLFDTVALFFTGRKIELFAIFHHLTISSFAYFAIVTPDFPVYYAGLAFFLLPGAFYSSFLVYKESEGSSKETAYRIFKWNVDLWLATRIVLFAFYAGYAVYCEWLQFNPDNLSTYFILAVISFFNGYYYYFMRRKLKSMDGRPGLSKVSTQAGVEKRKVVHV